MKKDKKGFFLPMTHEAANSIVRHLDTPLAKQVFNLLQFKCKNEISEDIMLKRFPLLIDEDRNYMFNLNRMRWEIEQLFEITPPIVQTQIKEQLNDTILNLENLIKRKNVIKELKDSNKYTYLHYQSSNGTLETIKQNKKKSEQLNESFLASPLLDEYIVLLNSRLDYFKLAILPLVNYPSHPDLDDYDLPSDLGLYADDNLRKYIIKWPAFIKICEFYSEPLDYKFIKRKKRKELKNYKIIEKLDGEENYQWIGIESAPIPSLTDFFNMLVSKNIFKVGNKFQQGKAIYKFFHLSEKKDHGFVLDDIFAATRKVIYKDCFDREVGL